MIKSKLAASIAVAMTVAVGASTAATLVVSGERTAMSLHALSSQEAVMYGARNLYKEAKSGLSEIGDIVDTLVSEKNSLSGEFNINEISGYSELSGIGAGFQLNSDTKNNIVQLILNGKYQSADLFSAEIYSELGKNIIVSVPAILDKDLEFATDNFMEDFENSALYDLIKRSSSNTGSLIDDADLYTNDDTDIFTYDEDLFDSSDFTSGNEFSDLDKVAELYSSMPAFQPGEDFQDDLQDIIDEHFDLIYDNLNVYVDKANLNGGSYNAYTAYIKIDDILSLVKDTVTYVLFSDDFKDYLGKLIDFYTENFPDFDLNMSKDDFLNSYSSLRSVINLYWPQLVSEISKNIGDEAGFTIYLSESVEVAGFQINLYYDEDLDTMQIMGSDVPDKENRLSLFVDRTGGKNIGDNTSSVLEFTDGGDKEFSISYAKKVNGDDFSIDGNITFNDEDSISLAIDGSYKEDGNYFDMDIKNFEIYENEDVLASLSFKLSFQPIDSIKKSSSKDTYKILEMDEDELMDMLNEMGKKIEKLVDSFN